MTYGDFMAALSAPTAHARRVKSLAETGNVSRGAKSSRQLHRQIRRVQIALAGLYRITNEDAQICRALSTRYAAISHLTLLFQHRAGASDRRAKRLKELLRDYRVTPTSDGKTWLISLRRWMLVRWRIRWTLALLDCVHLRRSRAAVESMTQLSRFCRDVRGRSHMKLD